MSEPSAYWNGRFLPASQMSIPPYDAGFVLGATVAEQVRTFRGQLFRFDQHAHRLARSLEIVGVDPGISSSAMGEVAVELIERNHPLLDKDDDLGLSVFVTPGPYPTLAPAGCSGPMVGLHTPSAALGPFAPRRTAVAADVRRALVLSVAPEGTLSAIAVERV